MVNVNPSYKTEELAYAIEKCEIKAIVAETEYGLQTFQTHLNEYLFEGRGSNFVRLCKICLRLPKAKKSPLKHVIWRQKPDAELKNVNVHQFSTLRETPESSFIAEMENIISRADMDDGVNIQFTSGTTGRPKVRFYKSI